MKSQPIALSPAQARVFEFLSSWHSKVPLLHLWSLNGMGRTTVLRRFQQEKGGHWIDAREMVESVSELHPFAMEEGILGSLRTAMDNHQHLIVDDLQCFYDYATGCGNYIRSSYFQTVFKVLVSEAQSRGCQWVVGTTGGLPDSLSERAWANGIGQFTVADYEFFLRTNCGKVKLGFDVEAIYRFAPNMNCYRLQHFCRWYVDNSQATTDECLEFIQSQGMSSNVDTAEVQEVALDDLIGCEKIQESLEENIILPLENRELVAELGLTPKRGVILAGPPGTGKTSVGRALARRLKGKFFLVDGTTISGTEYFYRQVDWIFRQAVENAPSIVFIDDSDVIFESGREHGLYRYLLTKLDGLESKSASNVCVVITAMDLGNIPPALVRSGRIELWLQTELPNDESRREILVRLLADKVRVEDDTTWPEIVNKTRGMSGADLKRVVQDAKLKLATDRVKQRPRRPFESYLIEAVQQLVESRIAYVDAAKRAYSANSDRPRWFNVHPELFDIDK